ncbi:MAG: hypothetical protein ACTHVH_11915, partial [Microbacterium gubbeenense]
MNHQLRRRTTGLEQAGAPLMASHAADLALAHVDGPVHPSEPIPTIGPGLGAALREPLGESGLDVFPLILGGGEFGWTIDQQTSFDVLDRYFEYGGNA